MKEEGKKLCNAREVFPEEEKTASAKALRQECGAPPPPPAPLHYAPADTLSGSRLCTPPAFSGPLLPLRQAWQPPHFLIRH